MKNFLKELQDKGQVAVEYVLLLVVVSSFVVIVFQRLNNIISFDYQNCAPEVFNPVCAINDSIGFTPGQVSSTSFREFRIMGQ